VSRVTPAEWWGRVASGAADKRRGLGGAVALLSEEPQFSG